jgi:4-amino-4-deoxy-L-arabinose transferase-like glycosyltransferase
MERTPERRDLWAEGASNPVSPWPPDPFPLTPAFASTHVLAWLPIIWTRALFPGSTPVLTPWRWLPFAFLFVTSGLLLYPFMSFHLFDPDEGRYAQIPREMLSTGQWTVPTLQGEVYLDKPPLFYWLVMISYSIFGFNASAARLVPALAMQGTVLLTYLLGRRIVGERSALWGALLLCVSPIFLGIGRLLVLDGLLTLWITLALLAAYLALVSGRVVSGELTGFSSPLTTHHSPLTTHPPSLGLGWWSIAALACGLGILTKGPVALALVLIPIWTQRRLVRLTSISWRAWGLFYVISLSVSLPWYAAVCWQQPEFVQYFLWQHNVERFVEPFDHIRPVWFYLPILFFGLLPSVLFAWPLARFMISTKPAHANRRCPGLGYMLVAGLWCVFFFSLAGSKLPTYILPAFPPLCLALGCFVARTDWCRSRTLIGAVATCWLLLCCSHFLVIPSYARERSPAYRFDELKAYCSDPNVPIFCFPRNVDSAAFYLGRSDFRTYRSKQLDEFIRALDQHPRSVILFGHRNSPKTLKCHLPAHLRMVENTPMGLCEMAVVERCGTQNQAGKREGEAPAEPRTVRKSRQEPHPPSPRSIMPK